MLVANRATLAKQILVEDHGKHWNLSLRLQRKRANEEHLNTGCVGLLKTNGVWR